MPLLKFLTYNNAVPIAVSIALLGAGGAFAATDPTALYSTSQQVMSVDNTYIANKDLSTYTPTVEITGVTEDTDNYYVAYTLNTIDVRNYVWQDVSEAETMTVAKNTLGQYGDLGIYVTAQLKNVIDNDLAYLQQVQNKARADTTQETVATSYGGLVGKFLNDTTNTLPGYTPVVTPPPAPVAQAAAASGATSGASSGQSSSQGGSSTYLSLQILGNNPAVIPLRATYTDLGVVLLDPTDPNLGYTTWVDGVQEAQPSIDTSTSTSHTIEYRAVDQAGNSVLVRRIVLVGGASDPGGEINTAGSTSGAPSAPQVPSTPPPVSTPTPAPAPSTANTAPASNSSGSDSSTDSGTSSGTSDDTTATTTAATSTPPSDTSDDSSAASSASSTPDTTDTGTADTSSGSSDTSDASSSNATSTGQ